VRDLHLNTKFIFHDRELTMIMPVVWIQIKNANSFRQTVVLLSVFCICLSMSTLDGKIICARYVARFGKMKYSYRILIPNLNCKVHFEYLNLFWRTIFEWISEIKVRFLLHWIDLTQDVRFAVVNTVIQFIQLKI
jgi:hypothetical protein